MLAQELDPRLLGAEVVFGGFDEIHERDDGALEPLREVRVGDVTTTSPLDSA